MSKVQIDDFICPKCKKAGLGELDTKTGNYISLFCDCDKIKGFKINFTRTTHGFIEVEAKDEEEAREKLFDGDWINEFDNKSDYVYDEDSEGNPIFHF